MNMNKKIAFFLLSATLSIAVWADDSRPQFLGVQLGFAQSVTRLNAPNTESVTTLTATAYNGIKAGVVYDATLVKGFGFSMALNYTFGYNATDWQKVLTTSLYPQKRSRGYYHQVEIPVDWQYKFEIAKRTWLILYTGPTLQCGIALTDKDYTKQDDGSVSLSATKDCYSTASVSDYALKRLNVTWGVGAGFQYERYFLRGGYDFGIINPYKEQKFTSYDVYTRGRFDQWQIKLGIYLWEF